jgi:hypothetical protein
VVVQDSRILQVLLGLCGLGVAVLVSRIRLPVTARDTEGGAPPVTTDRLVAGLRAKHPEWDDDRIERVATAWKRSGGDE